MTQGSKADALTHATLSLVLNCTLRCVLSVVPAAMTCGWMMWAGVHSQEHTPGENAGGHKQVQQTIVHKAG